ncbi:recombinase family protein [Lacunimicrobium album]|jgi:site-specific DNA recombinase
MTTYGLIYSHLNLNYRHRARFPKLKDVACRHQKTKRCKKSLSAFKARTTKVATPERSQLRKLFSQIALLIICGLMLCLLQKQSESAWSANPHLQTCMASALTHRHNRRRNLRKEDPNSDISASYARYSSELQRDDSIDQQKQKCRDLAANNGHKIFSDFEFSDSAISGTKRERTGLNDMIAAAERGDFSVLYLYSLSRLARESIITLPLLKKLVHRYGIRVICVAEGIDTDKAGWELLAAIYSVVHEQYIKDLGLAVFRGHEYALAQGYSVGDWCFGYGSEAVAGTENSRNGKSRKHYIINPEHAQWVEQIFYWFVDERRTIRWIVKELNRLKVPKHVRATSQEWNHSLVISVLTNAKYIGEWSWGETKVVRDPETGKVSKDYRSESEYEKYFRYRPDLAIIDEFTFDKAQTILKENAEKFSLSRNESGRFNGSTRDNNGRVSRSVLHKVCECKECGSPFQSNGTRLFCRGASRGLCSVTNSLPIELAVSMIVQEILRCLVADDEWFAQAYQNLLKCREHDHASYPNQLQGKKRQLAELNSSIAELLDAIERKQNSEVIQYRLDLRTQEKKQLERDIRQLEAVSEKHDSKPTREWLREQFESIGEILSSDSPVANETLVNLLVDGKIVLELCPAPLRQTPFFKGRFAITIRNSSFLQTPDSSSLVVEDIKEIVIEFKTQTKGELQWETAKRLHNDGLPHKEIGRIMGLSRPRVTAILKEAFAALGEEKPDGRARRFQLKEEFQTLSLYQEKADAVMELYDQGMLLAEIAERLDMDRNTVTSSIKYWHEKRGLPVPDGRTRRISLKFKGKPRSTSEPQEPPVETEDGMNSAA